MLTVDFLNLSQYCDLPFTSSTVRNARPTAFTLFVIFSQASFCIFLVFAFLVPEMCFLPKMCL